MMGRVCCTHSMRRTVKRASIRSHRRIRIPGPSVRGCRRCTPAGRCTTTYKTVHNRNAIDNQGGTMNVVVNFKTGYNNAFWNGQYMVFGNGDGSTFSDLTGSADVTAHEMAHGITEWSANLLYENQSGALNESFSDIFGTLFEFWLEGAGGRLVDGRGCVHARYCRRCIEEHVESGWGGGSVGVASAVHDGAVRQPAQYGGR